MIATTTTTTTTTTTATPMASRTTPANKIFYRSLAANVLYPGSSIVQKSGCNVCRVAHPRNDRFLHHRDRFTTSLQPFFPRPFSAGANFFFFFFFCFGHPPFFEPCAFVRSSFRSNSICHADGSFDNILPLDLYVSWWTTATTAPKILELYVRHNGVALSIFLVVLLLDMSRYSSFFYIPLSFPISF